MESKKLGLIMRYFKTNIILIFHIILNIKVIHTQGQYGYLNAYKMSPMVRIRFTLRFSKRNLSNFTNGVEIFEIAKMI